MKALEMLPLAAFFIVYTLYGMIYAAGTLAIVTVFVMIITYIITKRPPSKFNIFSSAIVVLMGLLTVITSDSSFIKLKPTIIYSISAITIIIGLIMDKIFIKVILGAILSLDKRQWKNISIQWIIFLLAAAVSNEIIWRSFNEDIWIKFKVILMPIITIMFVFSQIILYRKNLIMQK